MDSAERNGKYEAIDNLDTYSLNLNSIHTDCLEENLFILHVIIRQHNNTKHIQLNWQIQKGE